MPRLKRLQLGSLPSRERGLKCCGHAVDAPADLSLPSRERGLKYVFGIKRIALLRSLPSRERGLKYGAMTLSEV